MSGLDINSVASGALVLIACDFDGTIAAIAPTPPDARLDPRCLAALKRLGGLAQTQVAIVSGRPLAWLREMTREMPGALLFGSHGAEEDGRFGGGCETPDGKTIAAIAARLEGVSRRFPGTLVERKPFAAALHYRLADARQSNAITDAAVAVAGEFAGVTVRMGSMVVELCNSERSKGDALRRARYRSGAVRMVFLGDDVTDEDAFAMLGEHDLGIKVGEGETRAAHRVAGVEDVAGILESLGAAREGWLAARNVRAIHHHSMLSDQRTVAIVSPRGRVTWMCLGRIDSPALFAELVGGPTAGYFAIEPEDGPAEARQSYVGDSMVLRTEWPTFRVTDYLDCSGGRAFQRAGRTDLIRVIEGRGRAEVTFAPRLDFARVGTQLSVRPDGIEIVGSAEPCVLYSPGVDWHVIDDGVHQTAEAEVDLDKLGGGCLLELRFGAGSLRPAVISEPDRRAQTEKVWSGWAGALRTPSEFREPLVRAGLVIKALCHGPTGAIAAAATTSLPEQLGGVRNWDYRFCWPRDAAMAATALLRMGNTGHAMKLADWLVGIVDRLETPERFRPIYSVTGQDLGPEAEVGSLAGYADSRPVRLSNAAAQQVQIDVFGPIVDMIAHMTERGVPISPDYWRLVRSMVHAVEARWEEPDHGIWEVRGPRRHHVHSKVMCWHAVNRALVVHEAVLGHGNPKWEALRGRIQAEVLERGWHPEVGAFTSAYETEELDAAALAVGLTGLIGWDDPRWTATVDAINRRLRSGATVYRYLGDDGLPGSEGGFVICACWLVEALVTLGRVTDARRLLNEILAQAGPTGLMAEQWDPVQKTSLGNFPQAYSHLGVIVAALRLAEAEGRT